MLSLFWPNWYIQCQQRTYTVESSGERTEIQILNENYHGVFRLAVYTADASCWVFRELRACWMFCGLNCVDNSDVNDVYINSSNNVLILCNNLQQWFFIQFEIPIPCYSYVRKKHNIWWTYRVSNLCVYIYCLLCY